MSLLIVIALLGLAQIGYMANAIWSLRMAHRDYPECDESCHCHSPNAESFDGSIK